MRGMIAIMRVIGIDPGLATVGIGVVEGLRLVDFCTIETSPALSAPERLAEIACDLSSILKKHRPALAVVEKLYFERNQKTAMNVAEARGVILVTLNQSKLDSGQALPILEPTPLELKLAVTGDGKADKRQIQDMLARILKLEAGFFRGVSDDATDAVALAVYGALYQSREMLDTSRRKATIAP